MVEPGVVLIDSAVGHSPVAAGQPGDGAFDHRAVSTIGGLEVFVGGALAVLALNDHVLKQAWPGLVTGKLSDAAGLVVAPPLVALLLALLTKALGLLLFRRRRASTLFAFALDVCGATALR